MAVGSDLPPAYSTLHESSINLTTGVHGTHEFAKSIASEVAVSSSGNGAEPLVESSFENKNTHIGFIQKVLAITLLQHLAITIIMVIFLLNGFNFFYRYYYTNDHIKFTVFSALAYLLTYGLLIYCDKTRWKMPYKYMFLVAYPLTFGSLVGIALYPFLLVTVLMAWIYFCVVIFSLLLYSILAFQTKIEFTTKNGIYVTTGILVVISALTAPFVYVSVFGVLCCTLAVFMLCTYILSDLNAMVSKNYRFIVTPADFVMGALILHIDYRYIFMKFYNSVKITIMYLIKYLP